MVVENVALSPRSLRKATNLCAFPVAVLKDQEDLGDKTE